MKRLRMCTNALAPPFPSPPGSSVAQDAKWGTSGMDYQPCVPTRHGCGTLKMLPWHGSKGGVRVPERVYLRSLVAVGNVIELVRTEVVCSKLCNEVSTVVVHASRTPVGNGTCM